MMARENVVPLAIQHPSRRRNVTTRKRLGGLLAFVALNFAVHVCYDALSHYRKGSGHQPANWLELANCAYRPELYEGPPVRIIGTQKRVSSSPFLHIFLQFPQNEADLPTVRYQEFVKALQCNIWHPAVKSIHLLQERDFDLGSIPLISDRANKVVVHIIGRRILYEDAVKAMNMLPENSLAVLTNADIYLGDGFDFSVLNASVSQNNGLALTRYEDSTCMSIQKQTGVCDCRIYDNCHDSYVFRSPLPAILVLGNTTSFRFGGLWGSERVFLHQLTSHGLALHNPCFFLKTHHVHCSQVRPTQDNRWLNKELGIPSESSRLPPITHICESR
mmetsp:Transcript_8060/g.35653  ORF Transcript_8060/g.35653 Transcript_8060/m.35653 type:complete len:332 (-) Transcript_8060:1496-2491(-)